MNRQESSMTRQQFEMEYAIHQAVKLSFPASLRGIKEALRLSNEKLAEKLCTSTDTVERYTKEESRPSRPMAVALCVVLSLEYEQSILFLKGMGIALTTDRKEDYAYDLLLKRYSGNSISDCNLFLQEIGLTEESYLYPRGSAKRKAKE